MAENKKLTEVREWVKKQDWAQGKSNIFPANRKCSQCPNILPRNLKDVCSGECYVKKKDAIANSDTSVYDMPA